MASRDVFFWGGYSTDLPKETEKAVNSPTEVRIYQQMHFSSHSMECIDAREGIFGTCLAASWQCMQSFTDESH